MQPKTAVKFNPQSFDRVKRTIELKAKAQAGRKANPRYATAVPEEIGIQLTYACNLRCKHCFQWNDQGFFHDFDKEKQKVELDVSVFERLLRSTRQAKSNLYLWGGEPLFHSEWDEIARLLEKDPRWTVTCTNALLIEKRMESILRISPNLALLVSLDGLYDDNDLIRGKGTFKRVIKNINQVLDLQKKGEYKGVVSINCVLNDRLAPKLYEFATYCEELGIDTLYFGFPWYISEDTAKRMDDYYAANLSWLPSMGNGQKPSWHSYTYHLAPSTIDVLREQVAKLNTRVWKMRFRFQPALQYDELEDFVLGTSRPGQRRRHCFAVSNRLDVQANGTAGPCKLFPEFSMGDLYAQDVLEIWHSKQFGRLRELITAGLMPICSKCILLYLNGN